MELRIRSYLDLAPLQTHAGRQSVRRVVLDPAVDDAELVSLIHQVNKNLRNCGCFVAATFCIIALLTLPWLTPWVRTHAAYSSGMLISLGFAYVCGIAALGKAVGIFISHLQLMRSLRALDERLRYHATMSCRNAETAATIKNLRYIGCRRGLVSSEGSVT